jgi:hypothetical protein
MNFRFGLNLACLVAATVATPFAHAESFASSASSAGSASSGSVSDSLKGSSGSSTDKDKEKTASGDYRITNVAEAPDRPDFVRVTMQLADSQQELKLDLPQAVFAKQGLGQGDIVSAQHRVYGFEFAHGDTHEPFYLVLADNWHDELAARPVVAL